LLTIFANFLRPSSSLLNLFIDLSHERSEVLQTEHVLIGVILAVSEPFSVLDDHHLLVFDLFLEGVDSDWVQNPVPSFFCDQSTVSISSKVIFGVEIESSMLWLQRSRLLLDSHLASEDVDESDLAIADSFANRLSSLRQAHVQVLDMGHTGGHVAGSFEHVFGDLKFSLLKRSSFAVFFARLESFVGFLSLELLLLILFSLILRSLRLLILELSLLKQLGSQVLTTSWLVTATASAMDNLHLPVFLMDFLIF